MTETIEHSEWNHWFHQTELRIKENQPINGQSFHKIETQSTDLFNKSLKLVSAIFYQIFIFHRMMALQKLFILFDILRRKKGYDIETLSNDRVLLNKKYFYGKIMQKMCTES